LVFFILLIFSGASPQGTCSGQEIAGSLLERFSPEQREKLLAGKAIYEYVLGDDSATGTSGYGKTWVLINAPIEQCFKLFLEFEKQSLYLPQVKTSRIIKASGQQAVIFKELDYRIAVIKYTHLLTIDPRIFRVDFVTDPAGENDIKFSQGFFQFEKLDDARTLFSYALVKFDAGFKIPGFIQKYMTSRDLPLLAINLKKYLESRGQWRK